MYTTTWEEILGRKDLIGGEIWTYDGNGDRQVVTRALICGLREEGNSVFVQSSWCVRQRGNADQRLGKKWHSVSPPAQEELRRNSALVAIPWKIESEATLRIMVGSPSSRHEISYWHMLRPKGDDTFDPKDADFFPERWERLLALYPAFTEGNRDIVAKVCSREKRFAHYLDVLSANRPLAELMTTAFEHNETREEFLQCYLEALTGETRIHERVY